jgi:hypothetical protein
LPRTAADAGSGPNEQRRQLSEASRGNGQQQS